MHTARTVTCPCYGNTTIPKYSALFTITLNTCARELLLPRRSTPLQYGIRISFDAYNISLMVGIGVGESVVDFCSARRVEIATICALKTLRL